MMPQPKGRAKDKEKEKEKEEEWEWVECDPEPEAGWELWKKLCERARDFRHDSIVMLSR